MFVIKREVETAVLDGGEGLNKEGKREKKNQEKVKKAKADRLYPMYIFNTFCTNA